MTLIEFYKSVLHIENEQLQHKMSDLSTINAVKKGEQLIRKGQIPNMLYFLWRGIFRGVLLGRDGKDITDCFVTQCGTPLAANSYISAPAQIGIEAIVDSEVVAVPLKEINKLILQFPELNAVYHKFLIQSNHKHWELKVLIYQYTAIQRYQWFLNTYPGLIDQVGHKYIASFLNMTPVTLSRMIHKEDVQRKESCPTEADPSQTDKNEKEGDSRSSTKGSCVK